MIFNKRPSQSSINNKPQSSLKEMIRAVHESRNVKPLDQGTARALSHIIKGFDILNRYLTRNDLSQKPDENNIKLMDVYYNQVKQGEFGKLTVGDNLVASVSDNSLTLDGVEHKENGIKINDIPNVSNIKLDGFNVSKKDDALLIRNKNKHIIISSSGNIKDICFYEVKTEDKDVTIRIPRADESNDGKRLTFVKADEPNTFKIITSGSLINDQDRIELKSKFASISLLSNGNGKWYITEKYLS